MTDLAWRFDWQAAPEGSIQKWLLPTILSPDQTAGLSDATSRFTDVVLTIQVNGVEVSAQQLMTDLEASCNTAIKAEARKLLDSVGFGDLERDFKQAEVAFRTALELRLERAGITLPESED